MYKQAWKGASGRMPFFSFGHSAIFRGRSMELSVLRVKSFNTEGQETQSHQGFWTGQNGRYVIQ